MKLWLCALLLPLMAGCALMSTSYVEPAEYDLSVPEKPLPEVRFELGTFRNLSGSDRRFLYGKAMGKCFPTITTAGFSPGSDAGATASQGAFSP